MTYLFGYSDDAVMESESCGRSRSSSQILPADESRHRSRRSKSRETDGLSNGSGRRLHVKNEECGSAYYKKHRSDERKRRKVRDEKKCEHETNINDYHLHKREVQHTDSDRSSCHRDSDRYDGREKRRSRRGDHVSEFKDDYVDNRSRTHKADLDEYVADLDMERDARHDRTRESSRHRSRTREADSDEYVADLDMKKDIRHGRTSESTRHRNKENSDHRRKMSINAESDLKNLRHENEEVSELSGDYGDKKNMNAESDTARDISEVRLKETRHERTRKCTRHSHRDSRDGRGGTRKRGRDTDSGGDRSDRDIGSTKHHHRKSKSSTRQDDHEKTKKRTNRDEIDRMPVK